MAGYYPRVIAITKRPGQTFGFFLRVERGEDGHLIRCLEMGGPAELAGLKDGDRIIRVNGAYVDGIAHSKVVDMVRDAGPSVTFHVLDAATYKKAITEKVDLSEPARPLVNGGVVVVVGPAPKPKLCYLVKTVPSYGFSLRSLTGQQGMFMTQVAPGGVAEKAGVKDDDRLLEVNGENIEGATHDNIVDMLKAAGGSVMLLLADEETDKYYKNTRVRIVARMATVKHLPHTPRVADLTKGSDGYGFYLRVEPNKTGHFIKDLDRGSPAEKAHLEEMDRLVAVNGQEVDTCSHEQVVDRIRQSGDKCCLLVVDSDTDNMYKMGGVSPMLFWEEKDLPPSYPEAVSLPVVVRPSAPVKDQEDTPVTTAKDQDLKPKLCTMERPSAGYGFHLNGLQGVSGQYIKEVVSGGAADRAGMEEDDIVVEVNGVNVEESSHEEVVQLIRRNSGLLEMLVATKSVYDQLKAAGVAITPALLLAAAAGGHTSSAQVHVPPPAAATALEKPAKDTFEEIDATFEKAVRGEEEVRPESPAVRPESPAVRAESPAVRPESPAVRPESPAVRPESPAPELAARERTPSVSSASSQESDDERL